MRRAAFGLVVGAVHCAARVHPGRSTAYTVRVMLTNLSLDFGHACVCFGRYEVLLAAPGAVTVLIWKTAPGSSLVSAWTVAVMPRAASAPRTIPQGTQRNWCFC